MSSTFAKVAFANFAPLKDARARREFEVHSGEVRHSKFAPRTDAAAKDAFVRVDFAKLALSSAWALKSQFVRFL